jgi:SAM-dependent methyltransferase
MNLFLDLAALVIAILGLLWFFIPIFSGIPWVPTNRKWMNSALQLVDLKPGETVYDLGCGDGRVLITAGREYGARGVGFEISMLHCLVAQYQVWRAGLGKTVSIRWKNYYRVDLSQADVIYFYGHTKLADKLKRHLEEHLRDGVRIVSIRVDLPGWQPEKIDKDNLIFVYRMPPTPGDVASFMMQEALKD